MTEEMKQMAKLLRTTCIAETGVSEGELWLNTISLKLCLCFSSIFWFENPFNFAEIIMKIATTD